MSGDGPERGVPHRTQVTATLEGDLSLDVEAMHKATMAPKAALVRDALREYIAKILNVDKGIAERFARERAVVSAPRRGHLRVIK